MNKDELKKEAKILSVMAGYISQGKIEPTEEQIKMILALNNGLYRNVCKNNKKLKDDVSEDIEK